MGAGDVPLEVAEIQVGLGRGLLDQPEGLNETTTEALAADREVFEGTLGLRAVEGVGGHPDLAPASRARLENRWTCVGLR